MSGKNGRKSKDGSSSSKKNNEDKMKAETAH